MGCAQIALRAVCMSIISRSKLSSAHAPPNPRRRLRPSQRSHSRRPHTDHVMTSRLALLNQHGDRSSTRHHASCPARSCGTARSPAIPGCGQPGTRPACYTRRARLLCYLVLCVSRAVLSVVLGAWSVRFAGWADWVDCRCFLSFVFLGVARCLELSPCNVIYFPSKCRTYSSALL